MLCVTKELYLRIRIRNHFFLEIWQVEISGGRRVDYRIYFWQCQNISKQAGTVLWHVQQKLGFCYLSLVIIIDTASIVTSFNVLFFTNEFIYWRAMLTLSSLLSRNFIGMDCAGQYSLCITKYWQEHWILKSLLFCNL